MEEQVESDGRPDHLRQIAGCDGNLTQHIKNQADSPRIIATAGLREVQLCDDSQPRGKRLDEDRHQVGREQDEHELVGKSRAPCYVRGPISGIHITNGYKEARAGKGQHFFPERYSGRNANRPVHLGERCHGRWVVI